MRVIWFFILFSVFTLLLTSTHAQNLSISEIIEQSHAELIFVGTVESSDMTFNEFGSKNPDITFATFKVLRVLKGKHVKGFVEVQFPGHWGFGKSALIIFATSNVKIITSNEAGFGSCTGSNCYYSTWTARATKKNEAAVKAKIINTRYKR